MFEFEQSDKNANVTHPKMPATHLGSFGPERIASFSTLSWGEHCTECAFPTCYTTCSFYQPRPDGRCRRFEHGICQVPEPSTWLPYSACIQFRNWSMLWAQGNATQLPRLVGQAFEKLGGFVWLVANPIDEVVKRLCGRRKLSLALQSIRRRFIRFVGRLYPLFPQPDAFLLEVFNPEQEPMKIRLWMRGTHDRASRRFEWGEELPTGFSSKQIPMDEIAKIIDCSRPFEMGLSVENETGKRFYICSAHFVRFCETGQAAPVASEKKQAPKVKCVVWDLDHTLWDGVLLESVPGQQYPPLRDGVKSVLHELDKRGILLSIASKNAPDEAQRALEHHGLWNIFVAPQIGWERKSDSIKAIARELNIGLDTLAFIDDQSFERDEVRSSLGIVRTYDTDAILQLLGKAEFSGDRAAAGPVRRLHYQTDLKRKQDFDSSSGDYDAFLASCGIGAKALRPTSDMLPRIQDIVERTNQLNTSTNRYNRKQLEALLASNQHDCLLIECSDRYGSYGYAGFLVVGRSRDEATLLDCMFSCRIQGKRIDEAIVRRLVNAYYSAGFKTFKARYKRSERNTPAARMLANAGFASHREDDALLALDSPAPLSEIPFIRVDMVPVAPAFP